MARIRYSDEVKTRAVALAVELGPGPAVRQLAAEGLVIKPATLRVWCSRAGVVTATRQKMDDARSVHRSRQEIDRLAMAGETHAAAVDALTCVREAIDDRDHVTARGFVVVFGTLVDKVQVLVGKGDEPTNADDIAELDAMIDELASYRMQRSA